MESIVERLGHHAVTRGSQTALHLLLDGQSLELGYEALFRRSAGYARLFAAAGAVPGDLVILSLRHGVDAHSAYLGAMMLGCIPSQLAFPTPKQDPSLYWDSHRTLFEQMDARVVLTYPANREDLARVLPRGSQLLVTPEQSPLDARPLQEIVAELPAVTAADTVLVQFSSGTTGLRKGVALTHGQVDRQIASYSAAIAAHSGIRIASWLPLYHDMGLMTAFLMPFHFGATVVGLDPFEWAANPHRLFEVMDQHRCTHAWLPNFAFSHLARTKLGGENYRLHHIEAFVNCSEPCKRSTIDRFVEVFGEHGARLDQVHACYGMAETVYAVSQTVPGKPQRTLWVDGRALSEGRLEVAAEAAPGSMALLSNGPPVKGIEVRIAGSQDLGEIQVRGGFVFDGYYKAPGETARAFEDGWYRTGDIGCLVDGELYVTGRIKDIIIHHGRNYYAHDIEVLAGAVRGAKRGRCVAVGVWNDEVGSEEVELVAEREPGVDVPEHTLRRELKQAVAAGLNVTVARVHVVDPGWLVKTTSGKINRRENLAKLEREGGLRATGRGRG